MRDVEPRWSPDGAWVGFRRIPVDRPEDARVWLVPVVGGEARPLDPQATDARWGP
jgi:hypothetical protein